MNCRSFVPDQWHGIGDQHQSIASLAAEGNTQTGAVNVDAVADDPCKQPVILQRGAHQARLPGVQLRHGIEQMGHPQDTAIDRLPDFGCGGVAVAGRDTQSGADQFIDHGRGHAFRGQGHNGAAAAPKTFDRGEIAPIGHAYLGFRMNALARPVEGRSFQMKAENAGNLQTSLGDCSQSLDDLAAIGDEGRQAARGPLLAVRLNDASNASLRWLVVEKNAPASVHLDVDESRCKDRVCGKVD